MFVKKILNKKNKLFFFLDKKLIPKNFEIKRFKTIFSKLNVKNNIYCMPDLNFKSKNFIPSGVSVPLKQSISPMLLTPNNDGIGSLHFKFSENIKKDNLKDILSYLKKNIAIYRRKTFNISDNEAKKILKHGIKKFYKKWGFTEGDSKSIYNHGNENLKVNINKLIQFFSKKKSKSIPFYVKEYDLLKAAKKNLGVLDGSSHFIEFFKVKKIVETNLCKKLNIDKESFFALIHAGPGDVGRIIHHNILDLGKDNFAISKNSTNFFFEAYKAASNYAFANRLFIYRTIRKSLKKFCNYSFFEVFSDLPHDYIYREKETYFHNKGVIKMLKKNFCLKKKYRWIATGSPYILPTYPGGDAFIFLPTENSKSQGLMSHGIGRALDKSAASKKFKKHDIGQKNKDFLLYRYNKDDLNSQSPKSFKNSNLILDSIKKNNLAKNICLLSSIGTLKA